MKLLLDENLSPRLISRIEASFPGSTHVEECGLSSAEDSDIWDYAKANGLTIVSKDSDFYSRSLVLGSPPKIIWLRVGNCSTPLIETILLSARPSIVEFEKEAVETCLILTPK